MRKIDSSELKQIQIEILSAVDRFCSDNDIQYSMACGTLLGAIRHGGYIPWDDDIDIYMLRKDFNRFEKIFPQCYEGHFELGTLKRCEEWCLPFGKVYDNRTCVVEKRSKAKTPGVNIDVFPIDEVPDDYTEWKQYNRKRISYVLDLRHSLLAFSKMNSVIKNCGVVLYTIRFLLTSSRKLAEKCDKYAQIYNGKGYEMVFETSLGISVKSPFRKSLFDDIIEIDFENRKFKGFRGYDEYLTCAFGDYMTPPPINKRYSEHTINAFWKE